jgi:hypothetical protein
MEAAYPAETLVNTYETTLCYKQEDHNADFHRRENLRCHLGRCFGDTLSETLDLYVSYST